MAGSLVFLTFSRYISIVLRESSSEALTPTIVWSAALLDDGAGAICCAYGALRRSMYEAGRTSGERRSGVRPGLRLSGERRGPLPVGLKTWEPGGEGVP